RDQLGLMSQRLYAARNPVSAGTGFHGHRTARNVAQQREHLVARELPAQHHAARCRLCVEMEAMLAKIDSDQRDGIHDDLPKGNSPISVSRSGCFGQADHLIKTRSDNSSKALGIGPTFECSPSLRVLSCGGVPLGTPRHALSA